MPTRETTPLEASASLERYRLVDVREPHEFEGPLGAIEGAELIPLASVEEHARELAGSRPLLLICRSGKRSATACEALERLGAVDPTNLVGGMIAWNQAGLPVLHSEASSLAALVDQIVHWVAQVGPLSRDGARQWVNEGLARAGSEGDKPSRDAVEQVIRAVEADLEDQGLPDFALSLAAFRRSLAAL